MQNLKYAISRNITCTQMKKIDSKGMHTLYAIPKAALEQKL